MITLTYVILFGPYFSWYNLALIWNSGDFGFFAHFKHAHNRRRRIHGLAINEEKGSGDVMSTICLL